MNDNLTKEYNEYLDEVVWENIDLFEETTENWHYMTEAEQRSFIIENVALSFKKWKKQTAKGRKIVEDFLKALTPIVGESNKYRRIGTNETFDAEKGKNGRWLVNPTGVVLEYWDMSNKEFVEQYELIDNEKGVKNES